MGAEEWSLVLAVVFTGLWSGLLVMLTTVLHPMLAAMTGPEFRRFLGRFLPVARHAASNYIAVFGMLIAGGAAVAVLANESDSTPFVLALIGFVACLIGPLLVSNRKAEPNYDAM